MVNRIIYACHSDLFRANIRMINTKSANKWYWIIWPQMALYFWPYAKYRSYFLLSFELPPIIDFIQAYKKNEGLKRCSEYNLWRIRIYGVARAP